MGQPFGYYQPAQSIGNAEMVMAKLQIVLIGGPYNGQPRTLGKRMEFIKLENPDGGAPCWYRHTTDEKYFYAGNHEERPEKNGKE